MTLSQRTFAELEVRRARRSRARPSPGPKTGTSRFQAPTGALVFGTGPRSHGDHRAIKNLISHLRKAGAVLAKQQATHT